MDLLNLLYIIPNHRWIVTAQKPPKNDRQPSEKPFGKIAVIGAGLTGVSSAAYAVTTYIYAHLHLTDCLCRHCIAHNFDVVLYDSKRLWLFQCSKHRGWRGYFSHDLAQKMKLLGGYGRMWTRRPVCKLTHSYTDFIPEFSGEKVSLIEMKSLEVCRNL